MKDRILIVDDEVDLLQGLKRMISAEIDCEVITADRGSEALERIKKEPVDVVLADIIMPGLDGMALLEATRRVDPAITVILMTAYGTIELAVQAIKQGAYDFIRKPFDENQMIHTLRKGLERNRLVRENARLQRKLEQEAPLQSLVGRSPAMQRIRDSIRMLARTDVTVLILGPSGTGKELAARAIHGLSPRKNRPLVTVNCPAIPENILESELFGYCRGAFTNAVADKKGLFEEADGSSIFLDEIGDLSLELQTKLLRVLQEKEIRRLGDTRTRRVDVRIIASTNQDLQQKMAANQFREDLFYRLNVATLTMPPLAEIKEDIPLLVEHFCKASAVEFGTDPITITPEAMNCLLEQQWPGNVRELENTIRGITATTRKPVIDLEDLRFRLAAAPAACDDLDFSKPYKVLKGRLLQEFTTRYITGLLEKTGGNVSLAAEKSGIKRQSLQKIIKRYDIPIQRFRT